MCLFGDLARSVAQGDAMPYITPFKFRVCLFVSHPIARANLLGLGMASVLFACMCRSLADWSTTHRS